MRWTLVLLAACGSAPRPVTPTPTPTPKVVAAAPAPVPAPVVELPTFAKAGTLYMLAVADGTARCQAWQVDPEMRTLTARDGETTTTMSFDVTGTKLYLHDFAESSPDGSSSSTCTNTVDVREADDALVIDRSKWFRTVEACEGAIATHARVALDLGCAFDPVASKAEADATRPKFERILTRGGVMFSIVSSPKGELCQRVTFTPSKPRGEILEGELSYPIVVDGVKGTEAYSYELPRGGDQITLLGPGRTMADGSAMAYGCGGQNNVQLFADHAQLDGALYYTQDSCRAAVKRAADTAAWYPATEDEEVAQQLGTPAIGGC